MTAYHHRSDSDCRVLSGPTVRSGAVAATTVADDASTASAGGKQTADIRKPVDLWGLLVWAYQTQGVGRLGIGRDIVSKIRWVDYIVGLDGDGHPAYHPDAGAVHRVVCGVLDDDTARLVVEVAQIGVQPEPCALVPMPVAMPNRERGGQRYAVVGKWEEVPAIALRAEERRKLNETGGHGEVERSAIPGGALRWLYRVDLRSRRRCKMAKVLHNADGTQRAVNVGFAVGDQQWVVHCPITYEPSQEYVDFLNALHRRWVEALDVLEVALLQVPFRSRRLVRRDGGSVTPPSQ